MQAQGASENKNPSNRKPELTSQKPKQPVTKGKAEMLERVNLYYRYRIASLARACKRPIYEHLLGTSKQIKPARQQKETQLQMLDKQVLMKSKYRHRDKINFRRDPLLKLMKFNFEELREKLKTKKFEELYADLDDEETETKEEKEENKKEFQTDPFFNLDAFANYRKKHGINANTKIFAVGNYADLTKYLLSQGWHQNPDANSLIYDFKFITKCRHIDNVNQLEHQIVNHFQKSNAITTKYGLCRNIKNLIHLNRDPDIYYPRCFDLHDSAEFEDWVEDFKFTKVVAIMKAATGLEEFGKDEALLVLCVFLSRRYGIDIERKIKMVEESVFPIIGVEEWNWISGKKKIEPSAYASICKQLQYKGVEHLKEMLATELQRIRKFDIQFNLNRQNIWIVKPASRSRGRGIKAFSDLDQILEYIIGRDDIQWVAQKYIENPLIIKKRKFDIRQWVVLSEMKPLTIWMYEQCYIRFSAQQYCPSDIKNRFSHLTNNSVAKHSEQFHNDQIKGNMYFENQLAELVNSMAGTEVFSGIKKQMRRIIIDSLISVQDLIVPRKNTIQMYGYDFMIDEDFKPYLIEVNSSPCMEYSTHVTERLVKSGLEDFGKLVCEYMLNKKRIKSPETYGGWILVYNK